MGYGSYSHDAHAALLKTRSDQRQEVFRQTSTHPLMNPKGVRLRESRDSAEHPKSTPIVFALDVTGSMGEIPKLLAKHQLPLFMKALTDCKVSDPQVMFVAVGDATSDAAPLQVGQFETTAELMDQWLTLSFLEGGGGGQGKESYELALYFLSQHTEMDAFVKRQKKGFLFMTGDEKPYPQVSKHVVEAVVGDRLDADVPLDAVVAEVSRTFHTFFLIPDLNRRGACERIWRKVLGEHVICMEAPQDICFGAACIVAMTEKTVTEFEQLQGVLKAAHCPEDRIGPVMRALAPYAETLGLSPSRLKAFFRALT